MPIRELWTRIQQPSDRSFYLSVLRVFVAVHLVQKLLFQWPYFDLLYSAKSFAVLGGGAWGAWIPYEEIQQNFTGFAGLYLVVLVLFAFGVGRRLTALLVFCGLEILQGLNPYILNGGDNILKFLCLYLVFADSYRHLALDVKRDDGGLQARFSHLATHLAAWSIIFHVALVYFVTGVHKCHADVWFHGNATYYTLNLERFNGSFLNDWISANGWLVTLTTYGTVLWELSFIFVVWYRKTRPLFLLIGVSLHFGIWICMMIHDFQFVFMATYGMFFTDADFRRWGGRLRGSVRGRLSAPTAVPSEIGADS